MKTKNENILMISFAVLGVVGIIGLIFGVFYMLMDGNYFDEVEIKSQEQLGYGYESYSYQAEPFIRIHIDENKPLQKAGLQNGDEYYFDPTQDGYGEKSFTALLVCSQGLTVEIPIKRAEKEIKIKFQVPDMHIPTDHKNWFGDTFLCV